MTFYVKPYRNCLRDYEILKVASAHLDVGCFGYKICIVDYDGGGSHCVKDYKYCFTFH